MNKLLRLGAIALVTIASIFLGVRHWHNLEIWELLAYDYLLRARSDREPDDRILIVQITEPDIRKQGRWPISDGAIAEGLQKLQALQPLVIGLDVYRDLPVEPGHDALIKQLQKPNVVVIRNLDNVMGTPAPNYVEPLQVGFNDLLLDPDGVVRRNLLFAEVEEGTLFSFSLRLALKYLESLGITPERSQINSAYLQLGKAVFIPLDANSGAYQAIDARGYQILLNYRNRNHQDQGKHLLAPQVTFSEVLAGAIPAELVKNKIILIGTTAPSLKDDFFNPYSRDGSANPNMPGIVVHGQILSQILDAATGARPLFNFWSETAENTLILTCIVGGGIIGWLFRHPVSLMLAIGGLVLIFVAMAVVLFFQAIWIPVATPLAGFLLAAGLAITYQSYQNHQQQQIVMKLLGQNTSPEIAQALWEQRDDLLSAGKLPGILLTATLMFLDIKGFSTISETMSPEELLNWLNKLLDTIAHEVITHKGIINKFTGDGVMAVFGVPIPRETPTEIAQDAQNCLNCALAIAQQLELFNAHSQQRSLTKIQMRIGIYTGAIVVGSLGGKDRIEYGVIGDTVNTAARLEACEKERQPCDCRILIGKETLIHLQDRFEVEAWGPKELKGKKQMVEVYRVLGKTATTSY